MDKFIDNVNVEENFNIFDEIFDDLDDGCIETDACDWVGVEYDF